MVTQYRDASSVMGDTVVDPAAIDNLARGEYTRAVGERMPRDYVTMYHPDGSTSLVQLPPLSRNGKNVGDRQRKLMHYVLNKKNFVRKPNGKMGYVQWWYPSPPPGWKPSSAPWRCPVQDCTRAGGLKDLLNLWRHIKNKHPGEVEMYEGVLTAIKERLQAATAQNLDSLFEGGGNDGEKPLISEEELEAAKFQDAQSILDAEAVLDQMEATPAVAPDTFVSNAPPMCDCGWVNKKGTDQGMKIHRIRYCPLNKRIG